MKLSVLEGFQVENQEYQVGLLFYYPTGKHQLRAQIWNLKTDDVLFETIIKDWNNAVAALCTFYQITGTPQQQLIEKIDSVLNNNGVKSQGFFLSSN